MQPSTAQIYYLDSVTGSDDNDGREPRRAWRTIAALNATQLTAGDRVLFRGGHVFTGTLELRGPDTRGAAAAIRLASYGEGHATLYAGSGDGIVLEGLAGVVVEDLVIAGCGRTAGGDGSGLAAADCADLTVADVEVRGFRLAGISIRGGSDIRIERTTAHHSGAAGIQVGRGKDLPLNGRRSRSVAAAC